MDNKQKTRGIKRPRSEQIEALAKQNNPIPNSSNHDPAPFLPTTAKTEAAPMIQALKCMSSEEESRFEAFRRCTLPIDAVRKVLVASLAEVRPPSIRVERTLFAGTRLPTLEY